MPPGRQADSDEPQDTFDRIVDEGADRLQRPLVNLLGTGLLGGIDVGTGVLAYLVVSEKTHNPLLAGIAFSIGFVALLLGRGELFTENFMVPVTAVVARKGTAVSLLRLWGVTLVLNLVGGWVVTWLLIEARPDLKATAVEVSSHYARLGINLHSFALAVLAGLVITLMTRLQQADDSLGVRLVPAILFGSMLAAGQLFHSVLDSLLLFCGLHAGAPFGYLDWLSAMAWSALGNLVGGVAFVTFVRLLRVPHRIAEARAANSPD